MQLGLQNVGLSSQLEHRCRLRSFSLVVQSNLCSRNGIQTSCHVQVQLYGLSISGSSLGMKDNLDCLVEGSVLSNVGLEDFFKNLTNCNS